MESKMTDDFRVRIGSELDRLKPALEELKHYLETMPLSVSLREDFEYFTSYVRDLRNKESLAIGDRFDELPRDFQDIGRDLEELALPESDRQAILLSIRSIEESLQNIKALLWEMKLPTLHAHFGYIWTTEKDDWWLFGEETHDGKDRYTIFHMPKQADLIIEDDECYFYVIERMKAAGNRRVTSQEYAALFPIDLPEARTFAPPAQASNPSDPTESDNTEH
jgi:hypothetical protein